MADSKINKAAAWAGIIAASLSIVIYLTKKPYLNDFFKPEEKKENLVKDSSATIDARPASGTKSQTQSPAANPHKRVSHPVNSFPNNALQTPDRLDRFVNMQDNCKFAVLSATNGRYDPHLNNLLVSYLKKYGSTSSSAIISSFISESYFNKVLNGDYSLVTKMEAGNTIQYMCFCKAEISYNQSELQPGIAIANYSWEIVIVESGTGRLVAGFDKPAEKFSAVSEQSARKAAEDDLFSTLSGKSLSLP